MIAHHHVDALRARPNDPDVATLRADALHWLVRAGERDASTGAQAAAARQFVTAAELVGGHQDEDAALHAADLWMRAARSTMFAGDFAQALSAAERASALRAEHGHDRLVALADGLRGRVLVLSGRPEEARALLRRAVAVLEREPSADTVEVMTELAAAYSMSGLDEADELTTRALTLAQDLDVENRLVVDLLISRAVFLATRDRSVEAVALLREAQRRAEDDGSLLQQMRASLNIGDALSWTSPTEALPHVLEAERLARQGGFRYYLGYSLVNVVLCLLLTGDWVRAEEVALTMVEEDHLDDMTIGSPTLTIVRALRGAPDAGLVETRWTPTGTRRNARTWSTPVPSWRSRPGTPCARRAGNLVGHQRPRGDALRRLRGRLAAGRPRGPRGRGRRHRRCPARPARRAPSGAVPPLVRAERQLALARRTADPVDRVAA